MTARPGTMEQPIGDPETGRPPGPDRPPGDFSESALALARGSLLLVVTDDGTSPSFARARRSAIELARSTGGRILFYDRSAESRFVDPYASGSLTSDNEGSSGERMLESAELRSLGRGYLAEDIAEASSRGVAAWAWLPKRTGPRAIAQAVDRFGCDLIVVPAELGRAAVMDRPWLWARPRPAVGVPLLVAGPDGSMREWQFAAEASSVEFEVRQFGFLPVRGWFSDFDVRLEFDETDPEATRVRARIVAASLSTGLGLRDRALRGASFFDVAHHPDITFVSSEVSRSGSSYRVAGDLTIKDRTRRVDLQGEFRGIADARGYRRATMRLTAEVDRRDWDLAGGLMVADRATLTIHAVAVRASGGSEDDGERTPAGRPDGGREA
jgi:polyisoprenoid-binding protein YceI